MDAKCYATCLWPGLPELWYRGRLAALPTAVAFAAAVNFLIIARFFYPEWLAPTLVRIGCWLGAALWLVLAARAARALPGLLAPRTVSDAPDRFAEAQTQYLRGNWSEAEALLAECLEVEPRDPPALLLLAGVYRHTERLEAATQTLDQLSRLESADRWWLERQSEQQRLERAKQPEEAAGEEEAEGSKEPTAAEKKLEKPGKEGDEPNRSAHDATQESPSGAAAPQA